MYTRRCRGTRAVLLSVLGIALAGPAGAVQILSSIGLDELIDTNGFVSVGGMSFGDFSYLRTGDMPDASLVNIAAIQDDAGNFGIRIQGGFIDLATSPGASDALLSYNLSSVGSVEELIRSAFLAGNPVLLGDQGHISVTETFQFDAAAEHMLTIFADGGQGTRHQDSTQFTPAICPFPECSSLQPIRVTKDILALALAGENGGTPVLSFIDQTFNGTQVPEPGTALLVSLGLAMLSERRSRRRRN